MNGLLFRAMAFISIAAFAALAHAQSPYPSKPSTGNSRAALGFRKVQASEHLQLADDRNGW